MTHNFGDKFQVRLSARAVLKSWAPDVFGAIHFWFRKVRKIEDSKNGGGKWRPKVPQGETNLFFE